ncbi:MAG: hypothetical protein ACFFDN_07245 [Candidatus Hodarchaeota archaeon]
MNIRHIPISFLKEWHFCHCTAKFWGRSIPRRQNINQFKENSYQNISKLFEINEPIIKDEFTIIANNFEQKTTLFVDKDLFLMGSVDLILFNDKSKTVHVFNIKRVKKIPKYAYISDKNLVIIYNLLLFRFLYRERKNYQIKIGFEFLENYQFLLKDFATYKIGNPGLGYTTNKKEFIKELMLNPSVFFKNYKNQIFFIPFNFENLMNSLNELLEMINGCKDLYYIERNHKSLKKCKNCYYNKLFTCENSLSQ